MTRSIAHVSDLHLLAHAAGGGRVQASARTRLVSIGRPLDVTGRIERVERALAKARAAADYLIVSGDLTEMGHPRELEVAAEVLANSGFSADRITLVPGNHDRYEDPDGWRKAMSGPLSPFARGSAGEMGKVVDLGSVVILPIDVTRPQSAAFATGVLTGEAAEALRTRLNDLASKLVPVVVVQHHPAYDRGPIMRRFDGLAGWEVQSALFKRHANVQLLHGHMHEDTDRSMHGLPMRMLGAPAVVDDGDTPRVRLYEVERDGLVPIREPIAAIEMPSPTTTGSSMRTRGESLSHAIASCL